MKKILYVEDDVLITHLYGQKLRDAGYEVEIAEDGLVAMKRLLEYKPDLVLLDLLMPKMTGPDVLKFIRGQPELKSVRVVVISNSFLGNLAKQIAEARVEKALVKSAITPAQLVSVVHEMLEPQPLDDASPAPEPPQPVAVAESGVEGEADFQTRVQREFYERIPAILQGLRKLCQEFIEARDAVSVAQRLEDLTRKIGFLDQMAAMAGCPRLAQLLSAFEALLVELRQKPALINDSSRQTIISTVAFITERLGSAIQPEVPNSLPPSVLVVDDDIVSSRAVALALVGVNLRASSAADALAALQKLEQTSYDLVLLDINLPGMDGITLCEKMRSMPHHKHTPVIFVTGLTDFNIRERSILSGGDDLITKPVLPIELVVKAITLLLRKTAPASASP